MPVGDANRVGTGFELPQLVLAQIELCFTNVVDDDAAAG
jgi:hypothetical protein